tara:strand:+ start:429 stop:1055 length:627 start_codon:yes stop_codon:yes gene_type:complete
MANEIKIRYKLSQRDLYAVIVNLAGEIFNESSGAFETIDADNWDEYVVTLFEQAGTQIYYADEPAGLDRHVEYDLLFYEQGRGGSIVDPGDQNVGVGVLHVRADLYHADIRIAIDDVNFRDEYTITWFKNGVRITSGITSPTIQVIRRSNGTDLISSTAMTEIGSTASYKYDESTNRITAGEAVVGVVSATIDGLSRSFAAVLNRDVV